MGHRHSSRLNTTFWSCRLMVNYWLTRVGYWSVKKIKLASLIKTIKKCKICATPFDFLQNAKYHFRLTFITQGFLLPSFARRFSLSCSNKQTKYHKCTKMKDYTTSQPFQRYYVSFISQQIMCAQHNTIFLNKQSYNMLLWVMGASSNEGSLSRLPPRSPTTTIAADWLNLHR